MQTNQSKTASGARQLGRFRRPATGSVCVLLALVLLSTPATQAASPPITAAEPLVIDNDYGGALQDRLRQLERLRQSGRRVEIRGEHCFSSCTLYLGLPQTCISPETTFGFHGPSRDGESLSPSLFETYSRLIAGHYPKRLRNWYLRKGRTRIQGVYQLTGRRLLRMGAKAC